jgi:hypothetical protein
MCDQRHERRDPTESEHPPIAEWIVPPIWSPIFREGPAEVTRPWASIRIGWYPA